MSADAAFAQSWEKACAARDLAGARAIALLTGTLMPLWSAVDFLLEPAHARFFLGLRAVCLVIGGAVLLALRRGATSLEARALSVLVLLATSLALGVIVGRVDHFWPYAIGFSLVLLGQGAFLSWPLRASALSIGGTLVLFLLGCLTRGRPGERGDVVAGCFYGFSAAIIGMFLIRIRFQLERRAFSSAFALEVRNAELGRALANLDAAQARLLASEKLAALGRLLAGLSHEINNPLNVICNNVEPLQEHFAELCAMATAVRALPGAEAALARFDVDFVRDDAQDALQSVAASAERIRGIHRDLRAFTRGEEAPAAVGDLNECVRSTVALVARDLPPQVELRAEYGRLEPLRFRKGQVGQVLLNLVTNAVQAVAERGRVMVRTSTGKNAAVVEVIDDGPGVPPEARSRLFEPFFTTKQGRGGTGLGLATSFQIVEAHGGRVYLDPAHAPGARFVVELPAS